MSDAPSRHAPATRYMDLVNSDEFDETFVSGSNPFEEERHAVAVWFRTHGFTEIVDPGYVKPGDVIVLPVAWPGDLVGLLMDDGRVEMIGESPGVEFETVPLTDWLHDHDLSQFSYFRQIHHQHEPAKI